MRRKSGRKRMGKRVGEEREVRENAGRGEVKGRRERAKQT